ncbi:MAG TPA: GuaB3 family IMP dehydrogenase-related protein [Microthrixaceae bacterium]|nr:GuaB3 family IMP dehydrogenase-related protein [Microthrixaceae bacterium]
MAEIEIGIGKSGRRGFSLDEVAVVPSRRTRDADEVDISWQIDAYQFELPVIASANDGVTSPATAIEMSRLGGAGTLHIEGLWCRYEDPTPYLEEIAAAGKEMPVARLREIYSQPISPDLIGERVAQIRDAGATVCVAVSPARTESLLEHITRSEPDLLVIQGTITSAEHVSDGAHEPLDLKYLIRRLEVPVLVGGCASYQAGLHLMRTGAAGVLVGVGPDTSSTTSRVLGIGNPLATAIADVRAARMRHLDETGVYVHVIADGSMNTGGDIAKAVVCGADGIMLASPLARAEEAPGGGAIWSMTSFHNTLPRGRVSKLDTVGTLETILNGPSDRSDGRTNLMGGLRKSMALAGHNTLKDFQKADLTVTAPPAVRPGVQ